MMRLFLGLFIVSALVLNAAEITNGKVSLLEFDAKKAKALLWDKKNIPLLEHPTNSQKKIAFLPISYYHETPINLEYITHQGTQTMHLDFVPGAYAKEVLRVEPSKVSPPKEVQARIKQELAEAKAIYNTTTPKRFWHSPFEIPLNSAITSAYGNARVFNTTLQSYHSGVDFKAATGTPIMASNDGKVVLVKDRYYAGGSVIVDHGEGIYSVYYHLSAFQVRVGDVIKKGDIVGLSGSTGRVTGPHLHFGFMVQGVGVDPLDFISKVKTLF